MLAQDTDHASTFLVESLWARGAFLHVSQAMTCPECHVGLCKRRDAEFYDLARNIAARLNVLIVSYDRKNIAGKIAPKKS